MKKVDPRNFVLVLVSIVFTLGLIEVVLRIFLANQPSLLVKHYQDREFLGPNKFWKYWHYPNNEVFHESDCFSAKYTTNSLGHKAEELNLERPKIALIGDSFIEGYGVSNDGSFVHFLDSLFEGKYTFIPFATSGGIGTAHQLAMYESFARFYEPDLVILFWLNYNDLYDNLNAVNDGFISQTGEYLAPKSNSLEETLEEINSMGEPEALSTDVVFYTFSLAKKGLRFIGNVVEYYSNVKGNFKDAIAEVYSEEEPDHLTQAYKITEKIFQDFKTVTKRDSTDFLVVNLFDPYQVDQKWLEVMEGKIDKPMSADYPNRRIKQLCDNQEIAYYSLLPEVKKEIEEKKMAFPYFSHSCDNHLTEKGNLWLAESMANYLKGKNYLE